ncbi:MAG TPA: hypothetical protein VIJ77_07470 [Candidatus Tumulicola sp.]
MTTLQPPARILTELCNPEVRCLDGTVIVDRLMVKDPMIVDYYRAITDGERRASSARDAFVVGTRALAAAGGSATMAALDERLDAAVRAAGSTLATLPQSINAQIDALCTRYLGEGGEFVRNLSKDLASVGTALGADGHVVVAMRGAIADDVRRRVTESLVPITQALNVNDPSGPLGLVQRTLQEVKAGQAEMRELVNGAIRFQAQRGVSVHKGYDLEDFIEGCLGELAGRLSDLFENCSRVAGFVPRAKEGDFVSSVDPRLTRGCEARVVIEAKNRINDTVKNLCTLLDSAMNNRGALVGIGVLTNPRAGANPIAILGHNKIVVHLPSFGTPDADPEHQRRLLEMAYYVARLQAVAIANAAPMESLDASIVAKHLESLGAAVRRFGDLNRNFTAIETAVKTARATSDAIRAEVDAISSELHALLASHLERLAASTS